MSDKQPRCMYCKHWYLPLSKGTKIGSCNKFSKQTHAYETHEECFEGDNYTSASDRAESEVK